MAGSSRCRTAARTTGAGCRTGSSSAAAWSAPATDGSSIRARVDAHPPSTAGKRANLRLLLTVPGYSPMVREVASLQPRAQGASTLRVALAAGEPAWADEVQRILARRGGICQRIAVEEAPEAAAGVVGLAPREPIAPAQAAELAPICARAARAGRPVVMLASFPRALGARGDAQAAALAYLRA